MERSYSQRRNAAATSYLQDFRHLDPATQQLLGRCFGDGYGAGFASREDEVTRYRKVLELMLDFFRLETVTFGRKHGHGITTRTLGDRAREALGE